MAALAALAALGTAAAAELTIVNSSSVAIDHLYLSRIDEQEWGADLLAAADQPMILPYAVRTIKDIEAAAYDVRLIDENDRVCELYSMVIEMRARIEITDSMLADCVADTR